MSTRTLVKGPQRMEKRRRANSERGKCTSGQPEAHDKFSDLLAVNKKGEKTVGVMCSRKTKSLKLHKQFGDSFRAYKHTAPRHAPQNECTHVAEI